MNGLWSGVVIASVTVLTATLQVIADETVLYEAQWTPEATGLDAWTFRGQSPVVIAEPERGPALHAGGGQTELRVDAPAGHLIRIQTTVTYASKLDIMAMPLAAARTLRVIPLSSHWTYAHARSDPRAIELRFAMPAAADAFRLRFTCAGKLTLSGMVITDLGSPPSYEPDGTERLKDAGWEELPVRAAIPRENSYGTHRNGWMGWASTRVDTLTITDVPSRVHSGRHALMVTASGGGFRLAPRASAALKIKQHRCYDFSLWAKGHGKLRLYNVTYDATLDFVVSPREWRQFHMPVCVDNPAHMALSPGVMVEGRIFLDDLSLREIAREDVAQLEQACVQWTAAHLPARVVQRVPVGEKRPRETVTLENRFVKAVLSPVGGGRVTAFMDKTATNLNWQRVSLLAFGFPRQPVPIDWSIPFCTDVSADGTRVTFRHTVTGGDAVPFLDGLQIEHTFTLPPDSRVLTAGLRLTNTAKATRLPVPVVSNSWPEDSRLNTLSACGSKLPENYVLQAAAGDAGLFTTRKDKVRIEQPIHGWAAAGGAGRSLVFGFGASTVSAEDLDPTRRSLTWSYPRLALPPGGTWAAEAFLAAVPLDGVAYADRRVVTSVRLGNDDKGGHNMKLYLDTAPLAAEARVTAQIVDYENQSLCTTGPNRGDVSFMPPAGRFITRLDIMCGDTYSVELFNDPTDRVVGAGIHGAGTTQYTPTVPVREIRLPDAGDRRTQIAAARQVLWGFGLYAHLYPLKEQLEAAGYDIKKVAWGAGFPEEFEELLDFRVVVISNLGASHLSAAQRAALSQYVRSGGALLVTGGSCGLGNAKTRGTDFEALLPARLTGPFEVRPTDRERNVLQAATGSDLGALPWKDGPRVYWLHRVIPRPEATVLAHVGDLPVLIQGMRGRGTVVLYAGTVEGMSATGETAAWEWDGWPGLWQHVLARLQ